MRFCSMVPALLLALAAVPAAAGELGFPVQCTPGSDCFVQQYPDMDPSSGASDPFCGGATYDGHKGTDIRIRSLADMEKGVPVIAVADGTVLRLRTDVPDRLVVTKADAEAVKNRECGNGMVIDLGGGLEAQYCHLEQNSIVVAPGDRVKKGDVLGTVGASGMVEFPHVHVQFTRDGALIEPTTGEKLGDGCVAEPDPAKTLWDADAAPVFLGERTQLLDAGFTDAAVDHDKLVVDGAPPEASSGSPALVAWAWLIDLQKGDVIDLRLSGPDGEIAASQGKPLDRNKAAYSLYAGKTMAVSPGTYTLDVKVLRDGKPVLDKTRSVTIR